jgi:putative ABC transport system permease protein
MIRNYLKTALRSLYVNRTFSIINISGLAIGIAASILILMVVVHEFSYDRFNVKGNRIFRAEKQFTRDGRHSLYANPQFAPTLMATDARVVNYVRTFNAAGKIVSSDVDHTFFEDKFIFADTSFFSMFTFPLIAGSYHSLDRPATAVVSESVARKYFGSIDVVGKTLQVDKKYQLEITGIAQDPPVNSTVQFGIVASFASLMNMPERDLVTGDASGFPTYIQLNDASDLAIVSKSIEKTSYTNANITYSLAPLYDNHFNFNFGSTATTKYAYTFLSVSFLILLLALINYMNLTTAQSMTRAKEIGVRKVIGARRSTLSLQFYFESALTTLISFALALAIAEGCRPLLTNLLGLQFDPEFLRSPYLYGGIALLIVICIVVAGSYPAIVLSGFKPAEVLKGKFASSGRGTWFRKSLTVFQFSVSICLAICAVIMNHQVSYMSSFNTGIDREQTMLLSVRSLSSSQRRSLKNELLRKSGIEAVATASIPFYKNQTGGVSLITSPINEQKVGVKWMLADPDFIKTLGASFEQVPAETQETYHVLNKSAAVAFGEPAGQKQYSLAFGGDHFPLVSGKINGIVKDFNYESPRNQIQPLVISVMPDSTTFFGDNPAMYIRLAKGTMPSGMISVIGDEYNNHADGSPFSYSFLDDAFNEQQLSESRLNRLFGIFTVIALLIACLGLFGLITFSSERRKKELSIRKLLGASVTNLLSLISSEHVILLLISVLTAVPVALYISRDWLSSFFYQVGISGGDILWPVVSIFVISLSVICVQGIRASLAEPVKNLRSE